MRFSVIGILAVVIACAACKSPQEKKSFYEIGVNDSLHSDILKENRKIFVYVPHADEPGIFLQQKYPVLYLLDGDAHFAGVVAMIQHLSANLMIPEMIVVGIPNTDRSRDLTPTYSGELPGVKNPVPFLKTTGGGEKFTAFIEQELIPYVEKNYPTAPYRMLVGHSFGGLFAINALINHPQVFNAYVAIDPSMWWDRRKLLHHSDTILREKNFSGKTLFLSIANTMTPMMDTTEVFQDTASTSEHIRSILHLAKTLRSNNKNGLRFDWKYYDKDNHGSVPLISEYDALRSTFDYFRPVFDEQKLTAADLTNHYKIISEKIGYTMLPSEPSVNMIAYSFMEFKPDAALQFFELNAANYPASANVYDGLGDYYSFKKDTSKAIEAFNKALAIKKTDATEKKIKALQKK